MLRIYPIVLGVLKQLQPALRRIEVRDRDLARQLRRAGAREVLSCLEVAVVFGYFTEDAQLSDELNRIIGTLVRLVQA